MKSDPRSDKTTTVGRRTALVFALVAAAAFSGSASRADSRVPGKSGAAAGNGHDPASAHATEASRPVHLRLALAPAAASFMTELRVRALLEVELEGALGIAEEPVGPLDEAAVRVYIDQPEAASIVLQVQTPGRPLTRRRIDVTGLTWDVAARFTAIATAEIVRDHLAPARVRRSRPRAPSPAELEAADRRRARLLVAASVRADLGAGDPRAGPELAIGHATSIVDVRLAGSITGGADTRTAEVDLAAMHRLHAGSWLRAELGGVLGVGTAAITEGDDRDREGFGRVAARLGLAARVAPETWLGLRLEPGAIVGGPRDPGGGPEPALEGAVVGLALSLARDVPIEPRTPPRAR